MSRQDTYCQGQVVAAALLADISRTEVDGQICGGRLEADVRHGSTDAVVTLLDSGISQTREVEHDATGHVHFDGDGRCLQPHHGCTECFD